MSVRLVKQPSGVGLLEMRDEPGRNAMSLAFVEALSDALGEAAAWREGKAIVLSGLPDVFSSGADRATLLALARGDLSPTDILLPKLVLDLPIPIIAAAEGHAIGGGLALAFACDLVLLARESRYGASFMNMGITPGMGTTRLLEWALSPAVVAELLFTGEPKRGRDLEGKASVNGILPKGEVSPRALALADRMADKPREALELLKRTLSLPRRRAFEETITLESLMHRIAFRAPDVLASIQENHAE
jgi:polyketide biosynthesis enoyl-CoA hydratase PksI